MRLSRNLLLGLLYYICHSSHALPIARAASFVFRILMIRSLVLVEDSSHPEPERGLFRRFKQMLAEPEPGNGGRHAQTDI